ncbi:Putative aldehyde dehydrogenase [Hoyosella subflava DQS3-9A1]|uniref:Putative aldehyde dehydrogenase n=1 Tax=Hoyosella subflava (strain DSM 45089 / JCM 17490 / NBRC 109087 / DQS3-9A1) TaxID=443218 RepID=F6EQI9_HOYSD|nr:Putative aldehyde dehydrogenase [Hoyosella subflava DQS3-9A1]
MIERLTRHGGSGPTVKKFAPGTGAEYARLRHATADDVEGAFVTARQAQKAWAATPAKERVKPFIRFHDRVLQDEVVLDLIQTENGKARSSAFEEVLDVAGVALYYARRAPKILEPHKRSGAVPLATRTTERRHPKGVVGVISPWNAPLALGICDIIPALLAGNAVVHKPDSQTALTALYARELLVSSGLDPALWQIIVGDSGTVGAPLIDRADHICFTGSTAGGRKIAAGAAQRLISCTLELGGKNPMIVLGDADIAKAAAGAVRACFGHGGQLCLAIERIYVSSAKYQEFVENFVRNTAELRLGDALDFSFDIGSLTNQSQLDTAKRHVADAVAKGARILSGGRTRPDLGPYFFEPTILENVTPEMDVCAEETFGPVVSVYPFDTEEDAIGLANATEFGLNASVWSRDIKRANEVGSRVMAGTVNVNEGYGSAYASADAPMGGMKASGLGRRHGEHGLLEYTEAQTIASQHVIGFDKPPFLTARQNVKLLTRTYQLMKALRIK